MTSKLIGTSGFQLPDFTVQSTAGSPGFTNLHIWTTFTVATDRLVNTVYYNGTGYPIALNISNSTTRGENCYIVVDNAVMAYAYNDSVGGNREMMGIVIVPAGSYYQVRGNNPSRWYELRRG